ncbi:LysR substrate-binding domain-containing protein [Streptomyces sp. NPDC086519]|uniref:LysR substrate-binding domain-containing protein n=1 Tax=Streptomyces sp. NPDC086519 TaxID=3154863 RepID=UPI0034378F5E
MEFAVSAADAGGFTASARRLVDRAFRAAGIGRSPTSEVNDVVPAAGLVRNGLGACIMPKSIADRFPDLPQYRSDRHAPNWKVMVVRPLARHPRRSPRCCGTSPAVVRGASRLCDDIALTHRG